MNIYNSKFPILFAPPGVTRWAITIGPITFYSCPSRFVNAAWKRHEECHKRQWRRYWYVGFAVMYLYYQIRYGYDRNPFEVEARRGERQ